MKFDPKACLESALAEFKAQFSGDEDYTQVEEYLHQYYVWRFRRKSYNPKMDDGRTGDRVYDDLLNALARL